MLNAASDAMCLVSADTFARLTANRRILKCRRGQDRQPAQWSRTQGEVDVSSRAHEQMYTDGTEPKALTADDK
jgi:hypothetical protein